MEYNWLKFNVNGLVLLEQRLYIPPLNPYVGNMKCPHQIPAKLFTSQQGTFKL